MGANLFWSVGTMTPVSQDKLPHTNWHGSSESRELTLMWFSPKLLAMIFVMYGYRVIIVMSNFGVAPV